MQPRNIPASKAALSRAIPKEVQPGELLEYVPERRGSANAETGADACATLAAAATLVG